MVEQVPLVPLEAGTMPLVLVATQTSKGQLLEILLEVVAVQAEVTTLWHLRSAGLLNLVEEEEVLRMVVFQPTHPKAVEVSLEQGEAAAEAVKVVRLAAQAAHGAIMTLQLMAVPLVPQAEEVQEAQAGRAMIMPSVLATVVVAEEEQRHLTLVASEAQAVTQAEAAEVAVAQTLAQAESGVQAHKAKSVCGRIR